jgi:hypothetical protein
MYIDNIKRIEGNLRLVESQLKDVTDTVQQEKLLRMKYDLTLELKSLNKKQWESDTQYVNIDDDY